MEKTTGKASTRAKNKYNAENYDSLRITTSKGKKAIIKTHADKYDGGSINAFVNRAIDETMKRDADRTDNEEE